MSPTRILIAVTALHGATHLYTIFLQPLNAELKAFFGLSLDRDVTFFQSVYLSVYAASNLLAGVLASRCSPRLLLTLGPCVNGLAVMAMALLGPGDYRWMVVLMGLSGLGGGGYHPVANVLLSTSFPHEKGRALGIAGIGASLAFMLGPWGSSALVRSAGWSWQQAALAYGALGLCAGIFAWLNVPDQRPPASGATPLRPASAEDVARAGSPRAILLFSAVAILIIAGREIASWGATAIARQYVDVAFTAPPDAGFLLAMVFAPGLLIQPLSGRWSDRLGRERMLLLAMGVLALALWILPLTPRAWIVAPFVLMGAGMTASVPVFEALVADRTPVAWRGLVFGIVITSGIGLGALGPHLAGAIADAGGRGPAAYRDAYWALAGIVLACGACVPVLKPLARSLGLLAPPSPPVAPGG